MQLFQSVFRQGAWSTPLPDNSPAQWVLVLGDPQLIGQTSVQTQLKQHFPQAELIGSSTSGEIMADELFDQSLCLTAIHFDACQIKVASASIHQQKDVSALAAELVERLPQEGLKHLFVLSDGHLVNGSKLVEGFNRALPESVRVTGGLAGDGDRFEQTIVWHNDTISSGLVVAVGLYGDKLRIGHGHLGGWKLFGSERIVTKSQDNQLFELDGQPALEVYKHFLGEFASQLPASALRFPLGVRDEKTGNIYVRTILSINEQDHSMTFAGDIPQGSSCQLMRANYENLVDGAYKAAQTTLTTMDGFSPQLAILISCVGRRLVLNQRVEEELEEVAGVLPSDCAITGFYSYGEISPILELGTCGLHNQTMTITALSEES